MRIFKGTIGIAPILICLANLKQPFAVECEIDSIEPACPVESDTIKKVDNFNGSG